MNFNLKITPCLVFARIKVKVNCYQVISFLHENSNHLISNSIIFITVIQCLITNVTPISFYFYVM